MKTLITILFFIISTVVFSMDSKTQEYLLKYYTDNHYNLAYDVKQPTALKFNDFSKIYKTNDTFLSSSSVNSEAIVPYPVSEWYKQDFAEDPFDGRIEIYVVGEPLPSINISLLIACIVSIAVLQYRKHYLIRKNTY